LVNHKASLNLKLEGFEDQIKVVNGAIIKYFNEQIKFSCSTADQSKEPLVLSRKLGHPELVFAHNFQEKSSLAFDERWQIESKECYNCQLHKYTVISYRSSLADTALEPIKDLILLKNL